MLTCCRSSYHIADCGVVQVEEFSSKFRLGALWYCIPMFGVILCRCCGFYAIIAECCSEVCFLTFSVIFNVLLVILKIL